MRTELRVRRAKAIPGPEQREKVIQFFRTLGHDGRLLVLLLLVEHGDLSAGELQEKTGIEQTSLSHQLRLLKEANLVSATRSGQQVIYALDDDHVAHVVEDAFAHVVEDGAAPQLSGSPRKHRHG